MTELVFKSTIDVHLKDHMGGDDFIVAAALVSVKGTQAEELSQEGGKYSTPEKKFGLLNYLMKHRHGTPFEHSAATFFVHAPIFVWREWHRHRIGFCLSGNTNIWCESISPNSGRTARPRKIKDLWKRWHIGVEDKMPFKRGLGVCLHDCGKYKAYGNTKEGQVHLGYFNTRDEAVSIAEQWKKENPTIRTRLLPICKNLTARVLNEDTNLFELGKIKDIYKSGVKELYLVETDDPRWNKLRCSKDHRILTSDGWMAVEDLSGDECIFVSGKRNSVTCSIPPLLRSGIGVWTSMQRMKLIKPSDRCYICGGVFDREELVLDHCVPVVLDLQRALDSTNLKPACERCHREKINSENQYAQRNIVAGSKLVRLTGKPKLVAEKMTYDIEMEDPWHNFVANGIVVHNSYNEESARYKQLEPVFYLPPVNRPMLKPQEEWKPGRPKFLQLMTPKDFANFHKLVENLKDDYTRSYAHYEENLAMGFDPGLARDGLNFGIYSGCYVTCNPRSMMAFLSLRTHDEKAMFVSYPLYEIEQAARVGVEQALAEYWPITYKAFCENGRVGP